MKNERLKREQVAYIITEVSPRRPTRHCAVVHRFRPVRPVNPRLSCALDSQDGIFLDDRPEAVLDWGALRPSFT